MTLGRALRRIFLFGLGLSTVLFVVVGGFAWWAATHPEGTYQLIQRWVFPSDLKITWGDVHFSPRRITWLHWAVDLEIEHLLVTKGQPALSAPVDELALSFELSVWRPATRADFARVTVRAAQPITFTPSPETDEDESDEESPFELLQSYVGYLGKASHYASVDRLELDVRELRLENRDRGATKISIDVRKPPTDKPNSVIGFKVGVKGKAFDLAVEGEADASRVNSATEPFLKAHAEFDGFRVKEKGDLSLLFANQTIGGTFDGDVAFGSGPEIYRFKPTLEFSIDPHHADLRLKTMISGLPAPLRKIDPVEVHLEVPIDPGQMWSEEASNLHATAPIELFFVTKAMRALVERHCLCKIPERANVQVDGRVWLAYLTEAPAHKRQAADLRIKVDPVRNKLFSIDLAADLGVFREKSEFTFEPKLDAEAHVNSYKTLRAMLDAENVMIPSPFDVLDGSIDLVARNPVKHDAAGTETDVDLKVALGSPHQKIDLRSATTLKFGPTFKSLDVIVKLLIDSFQIQLPPLEPLAGLPPVAHDSRVLLTPPKPSQAEKKAGEGFKFQFFFSAKTTSPGAIRLLSELAKPHVPLSVAVDRAANGDLTGNVQLEPFRIKYLRRTVSVEGLRVMMDERDPANFPIDGRFRVDQTQYKIFLDLSGTMKSPSVRLSSEPYLPRNEIISVLLYDRTSDGLVSSDAETAGSFEAAMTDRAIGLFGLWAFASTPIKSFTYNPVTKVYSATVQLADGLTAGIGTNWEESASFEVRKRVSRRWVLTASWSPSEATHAQVGKLVLQWEKRF